MERFLGLGDKIYILHSIKIIMFVEMDIQCIYALLCTDHVMEITKVTILTQAFWYCRQLNHPKLCGQLHIQRVSMVLVFSQRESERSVQRLPELFHRQRLSK